MGAVLYVVATAIGNLADISSRARQVLAAVDLIACEDTRDSGRLLGALGIKSELIAYHDHNEQVRVERLLAALQAGRSIALISDAGTPLINDPGYVLVRAARAAAIPVVPIPGPCALIAALSAAGLPSDRFLFVGFPPRGHSERRAWLTGLASEPGTLICYESARRAAATLADVAAVLGPRPAVLARELTKRFETFLSDEAGALAARIAADPEQQLGEVVLLIGGDRRSAGARAAAEEDRILALLAAELPLKQAVALTARITGGNRNRLYQTALAARTPTVND
ncbi:MAG: 16S rRNA (cytidine(1402)-2'-O)-methyltransferase [Chromatiaceae bacterium]|nr:MAG: 16S rRNA (cytidine(1402)-2'-O)-methyltransferase [Chromatiaceae bacterium]